MFVCCELSARSLCDELITRPEESYRLWCVVVCNLETSKMRRPWLALGRTATEKKNSYNVVLQFCKTLCITLYLFTLTRRRTLCWTIVKKTALFPVRKNHSYQHLQRNEPLAVLLWNLKRMQLSEWTSIVVSTRFQQ
jgi:hypothetical protein